MPRSLMLAFTSPASEAADADYNRWYDTKHLHDVIGVKGAVGGTRYKLVRGIQPLPGVEGPTQQYVAIYELAAETEAELEAFCGNLRAALASGRVDVDPSLDIADLGIVLALPLGDRLSGPDDGSAPES